MISDLHRCIFVHIPRCAGTSVEDVIWPGPRDARDLWMGFVGPHGNRYQAGGLQHLLARQIRQAVGARRFDSYFKFSVVRDPFDRAVSQFCHMRYRRDLRGFLGMEDDASFTEYLALIGGRRHVQWEPQCSFLYDQEGRLMVDFVARFETLERDLGEVFERLGIQCASLPHENAADRHQDIVYDDEESRALVEKIYSEDFSRFGYRP
jgi:hypothetical protein